MGRVRVGIVGAGFIATRKHLPALQRLRDRVELVALADADEGAAREVAARFGVGAVYSGAAEMVERERLELLLVCTPPRTHAGVAVEALNLGCHVLVEKPMAVATSECDAMIEAAERGGATLCVAHTDLFYPPFLRARQLVERGALGELVGMRILLSTPTSYMTAREEHWAHGLPGGVIGETGPHAVYLTLAFVNPIREVAVHAARRLGYAHSPYDDYRIELVGDRATCSVTAVYTSDQWAADVDVWGTEGMLRLDLEAMTLARQRRPSLGSRRVAVSGLRRVADEVAGIGRAGAAVAARRYHDTHEMLIRSLVESIRTGCPPPVSASDGREAVRVMGLIAAELGAPAA